jgi:[acyl-carrier-protein] S-malonyltransferase
MAEPGSDNTLAFVFPGQGSQTVGMLSELAQQYPEVRNTFDTAFKVMGVDLWQVIQHGPEEELNQTHITQPAMLAAGVAVWRVWCSRNGKVPGLMAGHSLGEYTALVCAGALSLDSAVRLVSERGRFMQEAVPDGQGAMAAILGLEDERVVDICTQAAQGAVVDAVNFNSPGQVVIAGNADAVARAIEAAKQSGAKRVLMLPVSVPSHCSLMEPAALRLKEMLQAIEIRSPAIPVINNVDVAVNDDPEAIKDALVRQLYRPVRWVEIIRNMASKGIDTLVECGPGKVLAGLNRRIDKTMAALPVYDLVTLDAAMEKLGDT